MKYRIYRKDDSEKMHLGSGNWVETQTLITHGDTLALSDFGVLKVIDVVHHLGAGDSEVITDLFVVSSNTSA